MRRILAIAALCVKEIFRKKDFYVALILIGVILVYASTLQFYHVQNTVRYLMEMGLALIFIFSAILTVSLAARQYPAELQQRTCQVLLVKPVSRLEFILGKFLGSFAAGGSSFIVFYSLFLGVVWGKGAGLSGTVAFQTFYLFILSLFVLTALASAFSYSFTVSANVTLSLTLYVLLGAFGPNLKSSTGLLYYFLPHFEFFDLRQRFIHHWGPIDIRLLGFLTLYALCYAAAFLALGWLKFRKERL